MLFIVPTPIGNLEDITMRAIRVLKEVNVILAEDTRKSGILLHHFSIETKMFAYHQHNEHELTVQLVQRLKSGEQMALISDAGTPGISQRNARRVSAMMPPSGTYTERAETDDEPFSIGLRVIGAAS